MKKPETLTVGLLKELIGDRNIPKLKALIEDKPDGEMLDLIDRNDYFATVLWSKYDIAAKIRDMGIKPTKNNIEKVLQNPMLRELNNCTDSDWQIIEDAINISLFCKGE